MWDLQCRSRPPRLFPQSSEDAVDYIGRVHGGIELIEYPGRRSERSVLVCAGTGLMLALMDECPQLRWCIDVDGLTPAQLEGLPAWLRCIHNVTDLIVIAGWYSSTNPIPLARAARGADWDRLLCYVQCHGPGRDPFVDARTAHSLGELSEQVASYPALPWLCFRKAVSRFSDHPL